MAVAAPAHRAPTITTFVNHATETGSGVGRVTVRHTAAAPAVDLVLSLFQKLFLATGASGQSRRSQQAAADLTDPVLTEAVVQGGKS